MCFDTNKRPLYVCKGTVIQVVTISFYRFDTRLARLWAFAMMGFARMHFARLSSLQFWKLCGSGTGEGFTPRPNTAVYAILCVWPDQPTAEQTLGHARIFDRYQRMSAESWTIYLGTTSVRGRWSGTAPFEAEHAFSGGPIAALTRATIKPSILMKFWDRVPAISDVIGTNPDVMFKIGIGEVPFFHQITFSIWPDTKSMAAFARRDGPHAQAIQAVRDGLWFKEELYARFNVLGTQGSWNGHDPLKSEQHHA